MAWVLSAYGFPFVLCATAGTDGGYGATRQCTECPPLSLVQLSLQYNMKLRVYAGAPLNCVLQGSPLLRDLDLQVPSRTWNEYLCVPTE